MISSWVISNSSQAAAIATSTSSSKVIIPRILLPQPVCGIVIYFPDGMPLLASNDDHNQAGKEGDTAGDQTSPGPKRIRFQLTSSSSLMSHQ